MKDIVISGKALKRELWVLLGCLVAAYGVNVYAVLHYSRPALELVNQIGFTVCTALILYLLCWLVRIVALLVKLLIQKLVKD